MKHEDAADGQNLVVAADEDPEPLDADGGGDVDMGDDFETNPRLGFRLFLGL